jgi:hypothetical protein
MTELTEDQGVGYLEIVAGNRIVTVPKNYKTDRTIAIEPDMNLYVQRGFGRYIRRRLQLVGVDLNDQTRNQKLACIGSLSGTLATIDLSLASDTISRGLVDRFIRPDWTSALGQCRSPFGVLPSGEKIFYQKYSSMGNGFTFELETLIFWSLAIAYARIHGEEVSRICVYGDDIIVPSTMAEGFCGLLSYCGFTANSKKSYWSGPFRESCGKHYYSGYDITPFYVKRAPSTLIDLFKVHNQLFRFIERSADWLPLEKRLALRKVCKWLRSYAPASWRRPSILDGIGDGGFVGYFDEVCPQFHPDGLDGYLLRCFVEIPKPDESFDSLGLLVKAITGLNTRKRFNYLRPFEDFEDEFGVLPIIGRRYVPGKVFLRSSLARRQCTGLFSPEGEGFLT